MNLFKSLASVFIICSMIFLGACESNNHLRSEKKLKSQIQDTWRLVYPIVHGANITESWSFEDGIFYVTRNTNGNIQQDTGTYKIEATWREPYVTISDAPLINEGPVSLNGKWTIIELDDDVLFITFRPPGSGLLQREFVKE
ncbi:MAG: hypothetical protein HKO56_06170 [Bacteroidia bacterium]|nr:hypothetical protein [Bacteroidia bacterium]NNC84946.1 hypothetical protein [Bacteroidia bacterium]NNM16226.1 hypothetical protein [Bacteroidia bacterium]